MSPSSRGSGIGRSTSTDQKSATSATERAIGPTVSRVGQSGKTPSIGIHAPARLQPDDPAGRPREAGSSSRCPSRSRGRRGRRRAPPRCPSWSRRSSFPGCVGLCTVPEPLVLSRAQLHANSGRLALPTTTAPAATARYDHRRVPVGDVVGIEAASRTSSGPRPCRSGPSRAGVLPGERPFSRRTRARRAVTIALYSLVLTTAPARRTRPRSARTGTDEPRHLDEGTRQGRVAPNTSWRTVFNQRPLVHVDQEHGHLDHVRERAAPCSHRIVPRVSNTRRAWANDVVAADEVPLAVDRDDHRSRTGARPRAPRPCSARSARRRPATRDLLPRAHSRPSPAKWALSASKPPWKT